MILNLLDFMFYITIYDGIIKVINKYYRTNNLYY